jgi:predicted RNA-binding Zn-ribbon protein involved in translation (DUF1610 family)
MKKVIPARSLFEPAPVSRRIVKPTFDDSAAKLRKSGRLFWEECRELAPRVVVGSMQTVVLACPQCKDSPILRKSDLRTTMAEFRPCAKCGLGGDGFYLQLACVESASL